MRTSWSTRVTWSSAPRSRSLPLPARSYHQRTHRTAAMQAHDQLTAPKAGSRPSTPSGGHRISRPGTPARGSRAGTPSRIQACVHFPPPSLHSAHELTRPRAPLALLLPAHPHPHSRLARRPRPPRSDPSAGYMTKAGMPNNLGYSDPRIQDRASDMIGHQGTEPVRPSLSPSSPPLSLSVGPELTILLLSLIARRSRTVLRPTRSRRRASSPSSSRARRRSEPASSSRRAVDVGTLVAARFSFGQI